MAKFLGAPQKAPLQEARETRSIERNKPEASVPDTSAAVELDLSDGVVLLDGRH